jgi:hypothetical protein
MIIRGEKIMAKMLKSLWKNDAGNVQMIGAVVGILITLIVAILVFYNVADSIDTTSIDASFDGTPSANSTESVFDQAETFFSIAPINF